MKKQFKDLSPAQKQQVIEHAIRLEVRKQLKEGDKDRELAKSIYQLLKQSGLVDVGDSATLAWDIADMLEQTYNIEKK